MNWRRFIRVFLDGFEIPTRPVFAGQVFVCIRVVGDSAGSGIVSQCGTRAKGDRVEIDGLRDVLCFAEGARVLLTAFYAVDKGLDGGGVPGDLVLEGRGRSGFHAGAGEDLRVVDVEAGEDLAFVADEHHALRFELFVLCQQFIGDGRADAAVVPDEINCGAGAFCGVREADGAGRGEGEIVFYLEGHDAVEGGDMGEVGDDEGGFFQAGGL